MPISSDLMDTILVVLQVALAVLGGFTAALWVSLVIWTFRDIRSRSRDIFAQLLATLLVLIFNIPGLFLYFILRPQERLTEAYERALEEEALLQDIEERALCPGCKRQVERDFILCPSCHTPLKRRCVDCNRVLHLKWDICPYCGAAQAPDEPMITRDPALAGYDDLSRYQPQPVTLGEESASRAPRAGSSYRSSSWSSSGDEESLLSVDETDDSEDDVI